MGIFAVFAVSLLALLTFAFPGLRGPHESAHHWSSVGPDGTQYGPRRKAILTDVDGNAQRSADGTQMTRRDRGREFWEFGYDPGNKMTLRSWLGQYFHFPEPVHPDLPPVKKAAEKSNFTPKKKDAVLTMPSLPIDEEKPLDPSPPDFVSIDQPPSVSVPPAESQAPLAPPYPATSVPLHQFQMETLPVMPSPISMGRRIQNALQADETISRAARLTLRASSVKGKVILRGLVLNEAARMRIGEEAQEMAGPNVFIDNRLIALT